LTVVRNDRSRRRLAIQRLRGLSVELNLGREKSRLRRARLTWLACHSNGTFALNPFACSVRDTGEANSTQSERAVLADAALDIPVYWEDDFLRDARTSQLQALTGHSRR
jgi:hypothetical protein